MRFQQKSRLEDELIVESPESKLSYRWWNNLWLNIPWARRLSGQSPRRLKSQRGELVRSSGLWPVKKDSPLKMSQMCDIIFRTLLPPVWSSLLSYHTSHVPYIDTVRPGDFHNHLRCAIYIRLNIFRVLYATGNSRAKVTEDWSAPYPWHSEFPGDVDDSPV